jgi:deoxyribonuclease V
MSERFPAVPDLTECLRQLIAQVPAGRVTTCGSLADALGNRIAAKWVGHFALHHRHTADCTCHRIVRAGGELGGYVTGDGREKVRRLRAEGVTICDNVVDLEHFVFSRLDSDRPLQRLAKIQEDIQSQVVLRPRRRIPKLVAGVDVAYPRRKEDAANFPERPEGCCAQISCVPFSPDEAVAAYALVETDTGRLVWSAMVRRRVVFPYITSYLSFREIPILLDLLDEVRVAGRMAEVVLVDGTGILHHRRAGIASHLGVVASLPTIGVTKKLLWGRVNIEGMAPGESRPVRVPSDMSDKSDRSDRSDRPPSVVGIALRPTAGSRRPIFISPGHRVDVAFAEKLVRRLLTGRRLPEPLYWADRLSKVRE